MYRDSTQSLISALFAVAIALLFIGCIEMEMDMILLRPNTSAFTDFCRHAAG